MKKVYLLFFVLLLCKHSFSQQLVNVRFSKPFAIIKFLETSKGGHSISQTFKHQIDTSYLNRDTLFLRLVSAYKSLNLDYVYSKDQYPAKRKRATSTWDLICIAAISSNTNEEFFNKIIGILPNTDYLQLKQIVAQTEAYYDPFIYNRSKAVVENKTRELQELSPKLNELFDQFKLFYGSSWDKSIPFNLTIYPIRGNHGETTATPHANSLEMGFLMMDDDNYSMLSVGMHEMCHVLYDEQPLSMQRMIDSAFANNTNPYSKFAYNYFDEALATALGNGFAYNYLTNEMDSGEWYNDRYINAFSKTLYPLVEQYIIEKKQLDKAFIQKSITLFKDSFPNSIYDIESLLMSSDLYFENDTAEIIDDYIGMIHHTFRIYNSNISIPIIGTTSLESIRRSDKTQLIVIHKNQLQSLAELKLIFKNLILVPEEKNVLISFLDKNKRAVIILIADNSVKLKEGVKLLKRQKSIDPKRLWVGF